jgi:ABC-type multidrug transport system fused ATPase/permease subunit
MNADRIIVLKQGKNIESGTHEQLVNLQGEYYKLWKLQKGGYIKE